MEKKKDYIVLDIETTGLKPAENAIIEISAVKVINNKIVDIYDHLIFPYKENPSNFITKLTGITTEMLIKNGINIKTAIDKLINFVGKYPIIGHNLNFDMAFIDVAFEKYKYPILENECLCTLKLARLCCIHTPNYTLETLARMFNKRYFPAHRALKDVYATYELYEGFNFNVE